MKKKVELIKARTFKMDPEKPYIISLDETFTREEMDLLSVQLKSWGMKKVIVVAGPVKVTEVTEESK